MTRDEHLGYKIMNLAFANIKENLSHFSMAVKIFELVSVEEIREIATDGKHLFFNPHHVLSLYENYGANRIEYTIIHLIIHGYLGHFQDTSYVRKKPAWRVMDLAVEQIMDGLGYENQWACKKPEGYQTMGMSLYYKALQDNALAKRILAIGRKRVVDPHEYWWNRWKKNASADTGNGLQCGPGDDADENAEEAKKVADQWEKAREYLLDMQGEHGDKADIVHALISNHKKKVAGYGTETADSDNFVTAVNKEYSFADVFREFLVNRCSSKECPDYMDPMLYQYGLEMYGDVPLVEPLEEIEEVKLSNMVIAIDTSGSCAEYTSSFLAQVISIFREISKNFTFENIYLMQCDCSIKNICEFSRVEELMEINHSMRMYGFGGTSFIPVFRWINTNLVEQGKTVDCLLYLSDGEGSFPQEVVEYPTFFILPYVEGQGGDCIPDWIKKVYIEKQNDNIG